MLMAIGRKIIVENGIVIMNDIHKCLSGRLKPFLFGLSLYEI